MNQDEAADRLEAQGAKIDKIGSETSSLITEVAELKAAATESGKVSPRLQAAIEAVDTRLQTVDDLVSDKTAPDEGGETGGEVGTGGTDGGDATT